MNQRSSAARRAVAVPVVLLLAVAGLAGCGSSNEQQSSSGGGTGVKVILSQEPVSLASWNAYSNKGGQQVLFNIEEPLVTRDAQSNALAPALATSWKPVGDKTWRFTLREGVTFHDGSPFNAEAAAFGLNYMWSKKNNFPVRTFIGPELTAKAVDDTTLDVVTTEPDPILPNRLYFSPIPSMKQLKEDPKAYSTTPIGTGPYQFKAWDRGQKITLTQNKDWWGLKGGEPAPKIRDVTFLFRPDEQVRSAAVKAGEGELAVDMTPATCQDDCQSLPGATALFARVDLLNPNLADPRVRKAITLAIDKKGIIDKILGGGTPAGQLVGPSALGYADLPPYPFDPDGARASLAEAKAAGVSIPKITVMAGDTIIPNPTQVTQAVAAELNDVGFQATAKVLPFASYVPIFVMTDGRPNPARSDVFVQSTDNLTYDLASTLSSYYTCNGATSTFCDKDMDAKIAKASATVGDAREPALKDIAQQLYDDNVYVPIAYQDNYYAVAPSLVWQPRLDGLILVQDMSLR